MIGVHARQRHGKRVESSIVDPEQLSIREENISESHDSNKSIQTPGKSDFKKDTPSNIFKVDDKPDLSIKNDSLNENAIRDPNKQYLQKESFTNPSEYDNNYKVTKPSFLPSKFFHAHLNSLDNLNALVSKPSSPLSNLEGNPNVITNSQFFIEKYNFDPDNSISLCSPSKEPTESQNKHLNVKTTELTTIKNDSLHHANLKSSVADEYDHLSPVQQPSRAKDKLIYETLAVDKPYVDGHRWRPANVYCRRCKQPTTTVTTKTGMRSCAKYAMIGMSVTVCLSIASLIVYCLPCSYVYRHRCDNCRSKLSNN